MAVNSRIPYPFGMGSDLVTNVVAQTGTWAAIMCLEETVFTSLTMIGNTQAGTWESVVFVAGSVIHGGFTNFTLTRGSVLAYDDKQVSS